MEKEKFHPIGRVLVIVILNKELSMIQNGVKYYFAKVAYNTKEEERKWKIGISEFKDRIEITDLTEKILEDEDILPFRKEDIASIISNGEEIWDNKNKKITIKEIVPIFKR